jgi:hypothetical protein
MADLSLRQFLGQNRFALSRSVRMARSRPNAYRLEPPGTAQAGPEPKR